MSSRLDPFMFKYKYPNTWTIIYLQQPIFIVFVRERLDEIIGLISQRSVFQKTIHPLTWCITNILTQYLGYIGSATEL